MAWDGYGSSRDKAIICTNRIEVAALGKSTKTGTSVSVRRIVTGQGLMKSEGLNGRLWPS